MAIRFFIAVPACGLLALAACAQQEEPAPIRAQPVYDKVGNVGCTDANGRIVFIPGTANRPEYLPPCEELCDDGPLYDSTGQLVDQCLPPPSRTPRPNGGGDGSNGGRSPNDPTGARAN